MKTKTHQFVIPAKAGNQKENEKKKPFSCKLEEIVLFYKLDWIPAFAGMTTVVEISANATSNLQ
jgi:hypothetical protein